MQVFLSPFKFEQCNSNWWRTANRWGIISLSINLPRREDSFPDLLTAGFLITSFLLVPQVKISRKTIKKRINNELCDKCPSAITTAITIIMSWSNWRCYDLHKVQPRLFFSVRKWKAANLFIYLKTTQFPPNMNSTSTDSESYRMGKMIIESLLEYIGEIFKYWWFKPFHKLQIKWNGPDLGHISILPIQIYEIYTSLLSFAFFMNKVHLPILGALIFAILKLPTPVSVFVNDLEIS